MRATTRRFAGCCRPGADIFDAHLHLGTDIDGMIGDYDVLEATMADYGVSRAFVFCLDEPDRHPAFRAANDRTLAFAERSNGRLIPFVRLDLNEGPIEEAKRCLDAGARGIKLHPRAQGFGSTDERLGPVFELAAERRVPILIHGGRGLPPIADGLAALVEANPDATLIVAHAGIADMAALAGAMAGRKRVFFDTSTWSAIDLLDFYRQVPPEQVVYASDFPYGQQPLSLFIALKTARLAGYDDDQLRAHARRQRATASRTARTLPEPTPAGRRADVRPAAATGPDPPVPLDGRPAPLDAPAGHARGPRPRDQHLRRAQRPPGGPRPDPRAARGRARALGRRSRARGRGRAPAADQDRDAA